MATADLQKRKRRARIVGSKSRSQEVTPAPRKKPKNAGDPRGQFARFLRAWYDARKADEPTFTQKDLGNLLELSERGVRFWLSGDSGPIFEHLDFVADALGYTDWADLAVAIRRFCQTGSLKK